MAPLETASDRFAILPVRMPPVASYPQAAIHEIRVRRNAPKIPTAKDGRSLFLKNVPADSTEPHFRALFTALVGAGRFEAIRFDDDVTPAPSADPAQAAKVAGFARKRKRADADAEDRESQVEAAQLPQLWTRWLHTSSATAVVLLADDRSAQLVLKAIAKLHKTAKYPVWGDGLADQVPTLGAPWILSHLRRCRCDKADTQSAVHAFFHLFNRKEKEAAELAKKLRNEPDEDGFVTVTRGGRAAPASRNDAEEAKQRMVGRQAKKKLETQGFYRFQLRERRKEEQAALLRRFQEDKRKVEAMRENRAKFKPER